MARDTISARIPLAAKAIAIGRWHREAQARRAAIIGELREQREIPRAQEAFWIVAEACLAHFEGRVMTQKDLAARATGTVSPATISRAIQDSEVEGWIVVKPSLLDARVRIVEATPKAMDYYRSKIEPAWQAFWSIAEAALQAATPEDDGP
ncbi:MAG: MarR family winged helix-turn-helix transcriptional regulator [Rhodospirillales bacterium]